MNLFDMAKNEKYAKLDKTLDHIRKKFGPDAVKRASFMDSNSKESN